MNALVKLNDVVRFFFDDFVFLTGLIFRARPLSMLRSVDKIGLGNKVKCS